MFLSLATMAASIDSVKTIAGQRDAGLLNLAPNGSSTDADFIDAARADGMHDLFAQKDDFEAARAAGLRRVMAGWRGELPNLDIIRGIIALARAHNVALTLAIAPHHGDALEIYWRMGLWPRLEQLKVELATIVAKQGGDVALWDFMDYSDFNTEPIPAAGDRRTKTNWFWEPTHFKKQLGAIMVQNMFGHVMPGTAQPGTPQSGVPLFGVRLTPENVADRNAQVRAQREARVCGRKDSPLLTSLSTPLPDGCDNPQEPRGPT
ncbi:MAG TPA: hypothetical protein VHU42_12205 [Rhodopila sp.]|nr:hypothetical protein [Rhodopila sp.]